MGLDSRFVNLENAGLPAGLPATLKSKSAVHSYPSDCVNAALRLTYNNAKQGSSHATFSHGLLLEARGVKYKHLGVTLNFDLSWSCSPNYKLQQQDMQTYWDSIQMFLSMCKSSTSIEDLQKLHQTYIHLLLGINIPVVRLKHLKVFKSLPFNSVANCGRIQLFTAANPPSLQKGCTHLSVSPLQNC